MPFSYLTNTSKRVHFWYLLSSALLAFYVYKKTKHSNSFLTYLFHKKVWLSKSAWIDYALVFLNAFLKISLILPYLVFGVYLAIQCDMFLQEQFGRAKITLNLTQTIVLYTITLTIVNDFASFLLHYLMHKISFLWEFHKIHHSATSLNPFTQYRIHPVELILVNIRNILCFGLITGVFGYFTAYEIKKMTIVGVNALSFFFLFWGANLRHSHVKLSYFPWLEYLLISPVQHQIHHSDNEAHFNKNMGAKLAIWDWMFGTLVRSQSVKKLQFGLGKKDNKNYDSVWKNVYMPFVNIWRMVFEKNK